ncbi:hypothetical protein J3R82DRAFT_11481 [Butyriboletus roseoflavus]|nr:hypothetical protein J3R82DRAFT_11481 [Butyriboletus roseoflavus]
MSQQQKEIGTLVVVVLKAQHLHQPSFYKQNPYAQASFSGLTKRTKVDPKGGQHPVWDDELRFPVLADAGKDKVNRILEVSCYKSEQRGDDVLLGKGTVDIEETLKTGEFDGMQSTSQSNDLSQLTEIALMSLDWVPLETSAGARGKLYLEMTFYANSPPPLTHRPSKLSPSDRLARPAAYFTQGQQSKPKSPSPIASSPPGRSPAAGERKPSQPPPTDGSTIPPSLIPARGPQSQVSRQAPPNGGTTSVAAVKHRDDSLPPLPDNASSDVGSVKNPGLPTTLHPGGHSGSRPMPPQNRNRVISMGRPPPEILPDQLHRRTLSDAPTLHAVVPFSQSQTRTQSYSPEITSMTRARAGLTPSIFVEESGEYHPPLAFPTPSNPPSGPAQDPELRGVYAAGDYDSFTYGPPGPVYVQPNSPAYIPVTTQGYPRTLSPSQRPMPLQSPHTPLGQPQQLYDACPPTSPPPSHHQQYTQYPSGSSISQPLPPPQPYSQLYSTQPQQQQPLYPPQPQQHLPPQQPYLPPQPQQHQYLPPSVQQLQYYSQPLPYAQTPHPPQVPQSYQQHQHPGLPPSSQSSVAPQQQPLLYSQPTPQPQQPYFAVPPPPPSIQSQTPQPYTAQPPHQPQSYFSPPPPPPPPPPLLYSQGGQGPSIPLSAAQPSQTPVPTPPVPPPTSSPQSVAPVTPLLQPSVSTPLLSQAVPNTAPAASTKEVVRQEQVKEGRNAAESVVVAEAGIVPQKGEVGGTLEDVARNQTTQEQSKKVVEENRGQLEQLKGTEEQSVCEEKECKQQMEEDQQRREAEQRRQEELRRQEEELEERKKQEEEEQRKREDEEHRRREDEERRRREVEEFRKKEEEECRRREEERQRHRKQEEERIQREREEAERRREAAEEAVAERRWQEELARIRARAEQEAADAAFARAQMEADEAERRRQDEADLVLVRQAQEDAEREERLAQEKRRQEEADMEVARREQDHEEELERKREGERRKKMEEADRELARRLDMELNQGAESSSNGRDQSQQKRAVRSGRH